MRSVDHSFIDQTADLGVREAPVQKGLIQQKFRSDLVGADPVYLYQRQERRYRSFTLEDEQVLQREFESNGRVQAWDL